LCANRAGLYRFGEVVGQALKACRMVEF
jgi:hypothetical protein